MRKPHQQAAEPTPSPAALPPHLLALPAVALRLGVSVKTVRRMLSRGDLRAYRIGRLLRVDQQDLEQAIQGMATW